MNHSTKNHPTPNWAEMDVSLCELGYAVDLVEAVQTAIQTGDMPNEVCASSLFGAWMLLQRVYKDLKTEFYGEEPQQPDRGSF